MAAFILTSKFNRTWFKGNLHTEMFSLKHLFLIKKLHTHFQLSFLRCPALLRVFDVHHMHSEA